MWALRQIILKNTTNLQNGSKIAVIVNVPPNLHGTNHLDSCKEAPFQKKIFLLETPNSSLLLSSPGFPSTLLFFNSSNFPNSNMKSLTKDHDLPYVDR